MEAVETIPSPARAMMRLILGFWLSRAVYVAAKLGIADLLADGPKDSETLAEVTGAKADRLYRVLSILAREGVFAEVETGRFALTPVGECLCKGAPNSLCAFAIFHGEPWLWQSADLLYSVMTGETGVEHLHGTSVFQYLAENPVAAATFNAAMDDSARQRQIAMAARDFSTAKTVIDVGGGRGTLLASILHVHPHLRGVLFDVPHVIEEAHQHLQAAGMAERCEAVSGDFFQGVPAGGDVYVLSVVIHDWDDERALRILQNCRRAMGPDGTLLLVEQVIPANNEPSLTTFMDLTMMVWPGGRKRTEIEFRTLLASAGFELQGIANSGSIYSLIEARPV